MITQQELKDILHYDPDTGLFTRIKRTANCVKIGDKAGTIDSKGYVQLRVNGKLVLAHRLAFFYMTGEWPKDQIDHINGVRDDNKWANLREATRSQNGMNRGPQSNNTSGYKNISTLKTKWNEYWVVRIAHIDCGHLKYLPKKEYTLEHAVEYRNDKIKELHGDYANTN